MISKLPKIMLHVAEESVEWKKNRMERMKSHKSSDVKRLEVSVVVAASQEDPSDVEYPPRTGDQHRHK